MFNMVKVIAHSSSCLIFLICISMSCALPLWTLNSRLRYGRQSSLSRTGRSTGLSEQILAAVPIAKEESKKAPSFFVSGALPNTDRNFILDDNDGDLFS